MHHIIIILASVRVFRAIFQNWLSLSFLFSIDSGLVRNVFCNPVDGEETEKVCCSTFLHTFDSFFFFFFVCASLGDGDSVKWWRMNHRRRTVKRAKQNQNKRQFIMNSRCERAVEVLCNQQQQKKKSNAHVEICPRPAAKKNMASHTLTHTHMHTRTQTLTQTHSLPVSSLTYKAHTLSLLHPSLTHFFLDLVWNSLWSSVLVHYLPTDSLIDIKQLDNTNQE